MDRGRLPRNEPFVLLDDARVEGAAPARLYTDPVEIVRATSETGLEPLFEKLRNAQKRGLHAAGYLTYEAGYSLEDKLENALPAASGEPIGWFGLFDRFEEICPQSVKDLLPDSAGAMALPLIPKLSYADYEAAFESIAERIQAGDIYQANLTFEADLPFLGSPAALFNCLRKRASAGYGALINDGSKWVLSFSPELFVSVKGRSVLTKPMKGTAERYDDSDKDAVSRQSLGEDPKQRAENLMIVDLLRNDLSRVCEVGSVATEDLFHIETYPHIHQMTSKVIGRLPEGKSVFDLLEATFPCGSITGAPKIRAMEVVSDVERRSRGIYCGSIGRIDPDGDAAFNVAIRTLVLPHGSNLATIGLGSGIVADSVAATEWNECLAKGEFLRMPDRRFDLIETMRFEPEAGVVRLDRHLGRLGKSAEALGFSFDRHATRNALNAASFHLDETSRVRLLLSPSGAIAIEAEALCHEDVGELRVAIVPLPVEDSDFRLQFKTSDRAFYDRARRQSGADEVLFVAPDGSLTEGSYTNLFVPDGEQLKTPPAHLGLLPGVLRAELIETGKAQEAEVRVENIQGVQFFLGNSLRGLMPARLVSSH